jgi:hypothetical protein
MQRRLWIRGGLVALIITGVLAVLVYTTLQASAQGVRVSYGETVEGEIANAGDTDSWVFDGLRGDVVAVRVTRTGGNIVPAVTLTDSEKTVLIDLNWPQDGPSNVQFTVTLRTSGPHTLWVTGNNDTTGSYTLSPQLQQAGEGTIQDDVLVFGRTVSGEITDSAFRQVWSFRGTQDDVIDIRMTATSGDLDGYLTLFTPDNNIIASADSGGEAAQDPALYAIRLPLTGVYTVMARRAGANSGESGTTQGTYDLVANLRAAGSEQDNVTPTTLVLGSSTRGRLSMEDAPRALFSADAAGVLALALDLTDPSRAGTISVMTPEHAMLGVFSGISPLRASVVISQPGPILIEVSAEGLSADTVADFSLTATALTTTTRTARALQYDRVRIVSGGTIQSDAWYFGGRAGDLVDISVKPFTSILDGSLRVFAPSGALLVNVPVRDDTAQSLALTETGPYEIFVDDANTTYEIGVERKGMSGLAFNQRLIPKPQGPLLPGAANAVSGELSPGGSDAWSVDIVTPQTWGFELSQTGSDTPAAFAIEAPDGEQMALAVTSRVSNTAVLQVSIPRVGRYHVVVFDPTNNASHAYTLRGQPDEGGLLQPGTSVKGVLVGSQPYDKWQVKVPAGASVNVQLEPLVTGSLPVVSVFGADGQTLASSQWIESVDKIELAGITAVEGGTLQIVVAQPPGAGRFVYRITANVSVPFDETSLKRASAGLRSEVFVTEATPTASSDGRVSIAQLLSTSVKPDNARPLALETLGRGEISPDERYETWSFSANSGQMLEFSVIAVDDASDPHIVLLDRNGSVLAEKYQENTKTAALSYRFTDGGTYVLVIELGRKGRYTLWIQSLPGVDERVPVVIPGQAMAYGMTAGGEITQADAAPLYVFQGNEADVVAARVRGVSGNLRPQITLTAENGDVLISSTPESDPAAAGFSTYSLPDDGLYQLHIGHSGDATGRYVLNLDLEGSANSGAVSGGLLETQRIGVLGAGNAPTQRWLFTGHSGERVTVHAELLSSSSPTPFVLQLTDSVGTVFIQRQAQLGRGTLSLDNVLLPRTGIYQAVVSGGQRESGFYRVTLGRDPSGIPSRERAIRYGQTLGHVLTRENFLDVWTFAGSRGDTVTLSARPVRGDEALINAQLRSQDGQVVLTAASSDATAGVRAEHITLPEDGHYSILIGNLDSEFNGETAYELTVQLEKTPARSIGTVISYGQAASGTFYVDDTVDTWLFEGQQGDAVTITAVGLRPGLMPSVSVISTDWRAASQYGQANILATTQAVDQEPAQITLTLPYDGPYAVVISDPLLTGGNYRLTVTGRAVSPLATNPVRPDQTRNGQIGASDLADAWTFDGGANDVVSITVRPESRSLLAPEVRLIAPDGSLLTQADAGVSSAAQIDAYRLPFGGQYTVVVTRVFGAEGRTEGRYALDLQQTAADPDAVRLTAYGRFERGGLDAANPVDHWTFIGSQGDMVHLHVEVTSGDLDPVLRLYDSSGRLLASADDGQNLNAELSALLPTDGSYSVDVARYDGLAGTTKGNYALGIELAYRTGTAESGRWLVYGDRISGSTDAQARSAVWMFAGEKGDIVSAKIQFPVDDVPLTLTLRDPAGNALAVGERDRGDAVIEAFTLPASGDYALDIRRPEDARAIYTPYTLEVSLAGAAIPYPQAGGTLVIGQSVTGLFTVLPGTHSWVFRGQAGDAVLIRLTALNSLTAPNATLLAPDGAALASMDNTVGADGLSPIDAVVLPADGIYTLLVTGDAGSTGRIYRLSLQRFEGEPSPAQTISPLQDVFGTINAVHPAETWRFDSQAGEAIYVRLGTLSGDLAPVLMVWGPDNRPLMEGVREYTSDGVQVSLSLPAAPSTGTYQIVVGREGGAVGSTSGNYRLMLRARQITAEAATAVDVAFDQPVSDFIDGANPKQYAFQGLAGEVVAIVAQSDSAELSLSLETEDGTPLATPGLIIGSETGIPAFVLPDSGRYIVTLTSQEAADYVLVATSQPRNLPSDEPTRELEIDRSFIGDITDPTRLTYWTFSGRAGDVLNFNVDATGSPLRASVTLYGPRGYVSNVVQSPDERVVTLGPVRLPDDGMYHVVIGAWPGIAGDPGGRYMIWVERAEAGISGSQGGVLVIGQTVSGGLIAEDAQDTWTFDGQAGAVVDIFAEQTHGDDSLVMQLLAPAGNLLATSQPGTTYLGAEIRSVRLPETGTYQIVVSGELNGASAASIEYRLAVVSNQTSVVASMSEGQGIAYGQEREGAFDAGSNSQAWVFFGHAGERINVQVKPESEELIPTLYLLGPQGDVLRAETGLLAGRPVTISGLVLPENGFFGLVVSGRLESAAGASVPYSIALDLLTAGAQFQGVLEGQSTARLTSSAPIHEWTFSPTYSGDYVVQVTPSGGNLPGLSVTSGDTLRSVGSPDEQGRVTTVVRLEAYVSYSVVVTGGPAVTTQIPYTIAVAPAASVSGGGDLLSGVSNVGRIDPAYAANEWRVMGDVGQLAVEVQRISGEFLPSVSVFDADGLLIAEAASVENGYVSLTADTSAEGNYRIVVSGGDERTEGDYVITVTAS